MAVLLSVILDLCVQSFSPSKHRFSRRHGNILRRAVLDARQVLGELFLVLQVRLAGDLDALRLRRTRTVHGFGEVADRVAAQRHVLDQPHDAQLVFRRYVRPALEEFFQQRPRDLAVQILFRRRGDHQPTREILAMRDSSYGNRVTLCLHTLASISLH